MDLKKAIQLFERYLLEEVQTTGGYPAEVREVNGAVVMADIDYAGRPTLTVFNADIFCKWMDDAKEILGDVDFEEDFVSAVIEAKPEGVEF